MQVTVSLLVSVAGALLYVMGSNAKAGELGRIAYFVGLMWLIYAVGAHGLRL